jgi:predicted DNA-binding mobile mystery protein A
MKSGINLKDLMKEANRKARRRLDERLRSLKPVDRFRPPPKGWIRAVRNALGMSGAQLGARLGGLRPQTIDAMEKSEAGGAIQLNTLKRAAEALDCTLVYALVPNSSFETAVDLRARKIALRDIRRVAHTMELEAQGTGELDHEERITAYIRNHLKERDLWGEG